MHETDNEVSDAEFQRQLDQAFEAAGNVTECDIDGKKAKGNFGFLLSEFRQAVDDRYLTEQRWIDDLRQFKGRYTEEELEAMQNRSKHYSRKTRAKITSVTAHTSDVLFGSPTGKNFSISETPEPALSDAVKNAIVEGLTEAARESNAPAPDKFTIDAAFKKYAQEASQRMENRISDQLVECDYSRVGRNVLFSGNLYGTGILKGPLVQRKERVQYQSKNGRWQAKATSYVTPYAEACSIWRFYPDMSATCIDDCRYVWESHILTTAAMQELASRKSFDGKELRDYMDAHPDGYVSEDKRYYTDLLEMGDRQTVSTYSHRGKYELLERWGWLSREELMSAGVMIDQKDKRRAWFANLWMTPDGIVVKAVIAPLAATKYPYYLYYYDKDETSIFGEGIATLMREDQQKINAAQRALLDHAAITAGPIFVLDGTQLDMTDDPFAIHPFKVYVKTKQGSGLPVQAVELPHNAINQLAEIASLFDREADDITGIPKFVESGQNPTSGAASTATGLSMLISRSNTVIKQLIRQYDDVTAGFIRALYHWNMKYSKDDSIKGDFDVKATGSTTIMAKEMRNQQLVAYITSIQPEERPYIDWYRVNKYRAEAIDMPEIAKSEAEVTRESRGDPQAQEMQQKIAQLNIQMLEAQLGKLQAEIEKTMAATKKELAQSVETKVQAVFEAMQSAGVAVSNASIAPAGDEILRSSGWVDESPEVGMTPLPPVQNSPEMDGQPTIQPQANTAGEGIGQGIETTKIEPVA